MVEVCDDLLGVVVGVLQHGSGHAHLGVGEEGGEPLAVDVDAVADDHVVLQREAEAVADDLHAPVDLLLGLQRARLGLGRHRDAEVLRNCVHHRGHNLIVSQYLFLFKYFSLAIPIFFHFHNIFHADLLAILGRELGEDGLRGGAEGLELDREGRPVRVHRGSRGRPAGSLK